SARIFVLQSSGTEVLYQPVSAQKMREMGYELRTDADRMLVVYVVGPLFFVSVKWRPPVDGAAVRIRMGLLRRRGCLRYETAFGNGWAGSPTRAGSRRERRRRPRPRSEAAQTGTSGRQTGSQDRKSVV